ncbi:phospholipase D-like domain-containing protein [Halomonas sp. NCCP-2165]|nr:phospholipase D-like domain-containing protein [Halomonas sp. NCCP-2165]GKW49482.1 phospholipase D [Halomonas sp. NCCP-2165]
MWPWVLGAILLAWMAMGVWQSVKPLPEGIGRAWPERGVEEVRFLADRTWYDAEGRRHQEQAIFDEVLAMIRQARRLVVVDMFLFNDFAGEAAGAGFRPLSSELSQVLLAQKRRYPELEAVVITDPLNTLYGGLALEHLEALRGAGIRVVETELTRLRASNPLWSGGWHLGPRWFGNSIEAGWLPNAMGPGRVTLRSYLSLLNFNANHRKTLVVDSGDDWLGLVTSANPHDASSRHGNVALRFRGPAALDLLASERVVAAWSGVSLPQPAPVAEPASALGLQLLTEGAIGDALLATIAAAEAGDRLDLAVFYLAHRGVIEALAAAQARGVRVRVLLDPNRDAFGFAKNGIPNRPVAQELAAAGVAVRWCLTRGEQCHSKLLLHRPADAGEATLILGSANFTRRNLDNLNLETSVRLTGAPEAPALAEAAAFFEARWDNGPQRRTSQALNGEDRVGLWGYWRYRLMEATGLSTF